MGGLGGLLRWYNCIRMSFLFKKVLGAEKKHTHSTRCSLAVVTRDSTVSVQFKTICDAWREHLVEMVQYMASPLTDTIWSPRHLELPILRRGFQHNYGHLGCERVQIPRHVTYVPSYNRYLDQLVSADIQMYDEWFLNHFSMCSFFERLQSLRHIPFLLHSTRSKGAPAIECWTYSQLVSPGLGPEKKKMEGFANSLRNECGMLYWLIESGY